MNRGGSGHDHDGFEVKDQDYAVNRPGPGRHGDQVRLRFMTLTVRLVCCTPWDALREGLRSLPAMSQASAVALISIDVWLPQQHPDGQERRARCPALNLAANSLHSPEMSALLR
jgi:hypothetical protein